MQFSQPRFRLFRGQNYLRKWQIFLVSHVEAGPYLHAWLNGKESSMISSLCYRNEHDFLPITKHLWPYRAFWDVDSYGCHSKWLSPESHVPDEALSCILRSGAVKCSCIHGFIRAMILSHGYSKQDSTKKLLFSPATGRVARAATAGAGGVVTTWGGSRPAASKGAIAMDGKNRLRVKVGWFWRFSCLLIA